MKTTINIKGHLIIEPENKLEALALTQLSKTCESDRVIDRHSKRQSTRTIGFNMKPKETDS